MLKRNREQKDYLDAIEARLQVKGELRYKSCQPVLQCGCKTENKEESGITPSHGVNVPVPKIYQIELPRHRKRPLSRGPLYYRAWGDDGE